jgi:hypothetical protein
MPETKNISVTDFVQCFCNINGLFSGTDIFLNKMTYLGIELAVAQGTHVAL